MTTAVPQKEAKTVYSEYFRMSHSEMIMSIEAKEMEAFEKFSEARISYDAVTRLTLLFAIMNVYFYSMALIYAKERIFLGVAAFCLFFIRTPFALFTVYLKATIRNGTKSKLVSFFLPWIPSMVNWSSVLNTLCGGLFLLARVANGRCTSLDQLHRYGCNAEHDSHALPQDVLLCVMFLPIIYSIVFKAITAQYILLNWLVSMVCILIAVFISQSYQSFPVIIVYIPLSLGSLFELNRQNIILFLIVRKQQTLLQANKVLSEEAQNELRFMIANMAHDLKTPLSSFMNGVEMLSSLSFEALKEGISAEKMKELHYSMRDSIKNLFNVNNFMTMTVNRCIDYMKASKGIKLEPRLETINLQEVLSMPLNCMRDLQSRITINQKPIPSSVCSHIITDLQWFQENLFCLTSNAVKYSSHGTVTVTVDLVTSHHPVISSAMMKKSDVKYEEMVAMRKQFSSHDTYDFLDGLNSPSARPVVEEEPTEKPSPATGSISSGFGSHGSPGFQSSSGISHNVPGSSGGSGGSGDILNRDIESGITMKGGGGPARSNNSLLKQAFKGQINSSSTSGRSPSEMQETPGRNGRGGGGGIHRVHVDDSPETTLVPRLHTPGFEELYLLIEVEDTGIGLSDDVKSSLFAPFKQAQRRAGGTGLGLYSLAKRVDALGGHYGVSNRRDGEQGSIFWFAIPYRPDVAATERSFRSVRESTSRSTTTSLGEQIINTASSIVAPIVQKSPTFSVKKIRLAPLSPTSKQPAPGKLRILLVDDSVTILKMTSNLLRRHGHVVDQEENGADALARLEKTRSGPQSTPPYDVMLIDLNMPVMDGLEATKRLRDVERQLNAASGGFEYHQKVFAFSANSDRATMQEAMDAGADDFISKPFSIQTFQEKCDKFCPQPTSPPIQTP